MFLYGLRADTQGRADFDVTEVLCDQGGNFGLRIVSGSRLVVGNFTFNFTFAFGFAFAFFFAILDSLNSKLETRTLFF